LEQLVLVDQLVLSEFKDHRDLQDFQVQQVPLDRREYLVQQGSQVPQGHPVGLVMVHVVQLVQ
jgi:hypothetical protein